MFVRLLKSTEQTSLAVQCPTNPVQLCAALNSSVAKETLVDRLTSPVAPLKWHLHPTDKRSSYVVLCGTNGLLLSVVPPFSIAGACCDEREQREQLVKLEAASYA